MQSACIEIDFRTQSVSEVSATSREATCPPENGQLQAVSPVRIFPSLVKALGWMVADQDYGSSMPESLASYDLDSQSWKTSALSLFGDSIEFSGALPKSGMMRNGKIYALPMSARPIVENESGLWPTPLASEWKDARPSLASREKGKLYEGLSGCVKHRKKWPTPRTKGMCGGTGNWNQLKEKCKDITEARQMGAGNGGQLNPTWVEWLMGYPLGWTDLNASVIR